MFERLENILKKYEELKNELTNPEVLSDYNKLKVLSKEQSDLEENGCNVARDIQRWSERPHLRHKKLIHFSYLSCTKPS